jgi:carbamoyl-phosphate synthase large subunit
VLIEESLLGWKEFEMEVMRDKADNCVIICSIENLDPMGVHTGDSITVAPIQTLTDREYQIMRDFSFAVHPRDRRGDRRIEHPVRRASRHGPHDRHRDEPARQPQLRARVEGHRLPHREDRREARRRLHARRAEKRHHAHTPASFEPTIDYVVTKIPRFTFEKFPGANETLTTQMKSVGEAMAIGRTFKESLQKALRSLEIKRFGLIGDGADKEVDDETLTTKLTVPNAERIFFLGQAFAKGWDVEKCLLAHQDRSVVLEAD